MTITATAQVGPELREEVRKSGSETLRNWGAFLHSSLIRGDLEAVSQGRWREGPSLRRFPPGVDGVPLLERLQTLASEDVTCPWQALSSGSCIGRAGYKV